MFRQIFVLLALFLCLSYAQAQYTTEVSTDQFTVNIDVSNAVPRWVFYNAGNQSYSYQVTCTGLWEIENGTAYDVVVGTTRTRFDNLVVSDAVDIPGENAKLVAVTALAPVPGVGLISFNTRIPLDATNDTSYPAAKFNVTIVGYQWTSSLSSAQLVVGFLVDSINNAHTEKSNLTTHGSKTVDWANAYFHINSTAAAGAKLNTTVSATLKRQEDATMSFSQGENYVDLANVYVIYDHFDDALDHDPEIGFGEGPGNSYIWIIIIVVVVIALIVIILIAVIGFVLVRRRRRSYDAF